MGSRSCPIAEMRHHSKGARALLDETVLFAALVILLVVVLIAALVVRLVRESRKWRRFRELLRDWLEERETHESQ